MDTNVVASAARLAVAVYSAEALRRWVLSALELSAGDSGLYTRNRGLR